jgi:hypothetical protein
MGSWTGVVLLPKHFTPDQCSDVEESLREVSDEIRDTRKGRHWRALIGNAWYSIDIEATDFPDNDVEVFLLEHDLDLNVVPDQLIVNSPTKSQEHRDVVELLCQRLAERLKGWKITNAR